MKNLSVEAAVICDDIRIEDNGKHILIGVYNDIRVLKFPSQLMFAIWLQVFAHETGTFPFEIRMRGDHEEEFFSINVGLNALATGLASVGIRGLPLVLQIPGSLHIQMQQAGGEWETIKTFPVASAEPAAKLA